MSRQPQSNSQRSQKGTNDSLKDNKTRLTDALRRLDRRTVSFPSTTEIDKLSESSLEPHLGVLVKHIVGQTRTNHIRRQLQDLQNSNLPKSIISEVFPEDLVQKRRQISSSKIEDSRERTSNLELEYSSKDAERCRILDEINACRHEFKLANDLVPIASQTSGSFRHFQTFTMDFNSEANSQIIADILDNTSVLIQEIEENPSNSDLSSQTDKLSYSPRAYPPWRQLLERTNQLINEHQLPSTIRSHPPDATNASEAILELKQELLAISASCADSSAVLDNTSIEDQLQAAEHYPNYPGRDTIIEQARTSARTRIGSALSPAMVQDNELQDAEARLAALYDRTTRLLAASKALMRDNKNLVIKLPAEIRELPPMVTAISGLKDQLSGCIEERRVEARGSLVENPATFSEEVCTVLGLPLGTPPDAIYDHVRNILSRPS